MGKKNHLPLPKIFVLGLANIAIAMAGWEEIAIASQIPAQDINLHLNQTQKQVTKERPSSYHPLFTLETVNDETVSDKPIRQPFEEPILIAAPQNLDPSLLEQDSPPNSTDAFEAPAYELADPSESAEPADIGNELGEDDLITEASVPFVEWDSLELDLKDSLSNFGQGNRILTPVLRGQLANGDTVTLSPGFNQFSLPDLETVIHVPLTLGVEGAIDDVDFALSGGVDIYNRLPIDSHFTVKASTQVWTGATMSVSVHRGPYLFNAETLENGIAAWRYGPDLFWQIDPKTSLFSLLRIGHFNDGNFEQQSFSRLERKFWNGGAIAANVFNWSFQENLESASGYFSPPDFLVASIELSWEQEIIDNISCRAAASVGQQRLNGDWAAGYGHQALCSFTGLPGIGFDLGYSFSNVGNGQTFLSEDSAYNNLEVIGGVKTQF